VSPQGSDIGKREDVFGGRNSFKHQSLNAGAIMPGRLYQVFLETFSYRNRPACYAFFMDL
jgi:hypothetical protein